MSKKNRNRQMQEMPISMEAPAEEQAEKLDFDAWYVMREAKIPKAHHKEIIKADFKGRGLGQQESVNDFDAALKKYGVKLA